MRSLVDECTGPGVAAWLRQGGHDVFSVYEQSRGADDETLLRQAFAEERILITNDKDFGEKVFRDAIPHKGVVLLRLDESGWPRRSPSYKSCSMGTRIGWQVDLLW